MVRLLLIGSDHTRGPLAQLGALRAAHDAVLARLVHLRGRGDCAGGVLVDTCNRFEVLLDLGCDHPIELEAMQAALFDGLPPVPLHAFADADAVLHLLRVATGLESLVRGEDQISGQLARAFQEASEIDLVSKRLNRLWARLAPSSRHLRGKRPSDAAPRSVAELAARIGREAGDRIAVIGAGVTARVAVEALHKLSVRELSVWNRTSSRAQALAAHFGARNGSLAEFLADPPDVQAVILAINGRELQLPLAAMPQLRAVIDISQPSVLDAAVRARQDLQVLDLDLLGQHAGLETARSDGWLEQAGELARGAAGHIWAEIGGGSENGHLGHLVEMHLAVAREEVEHSFQNGLGSLSEAQRAAVAKLCERVARRNAHMHVKDMREVVQL